ncbi:aspartate-semialdehyde dehydrogenase [Candidatus Desantisbacteria bacterium]|nr:aspartate-semialdehyde dehydrogenase [Candidatus Desantisbacteria bacterium]
MKKYTVAVVGATGAVGQVMREVLIERNFPVEKARFFGYRREGMELDFKGEKVVVEKLTDGCFKGIDIALFSAGASVSKEWAPKAASEGCIVVDNSSAFRMDADIPLVVPEVNPHAIANHKGIIANPNCSTIQMVVALNPLHLEARIKRIVVSTYQAVSGTGTAAIKELIDQSKAVLDGQPSPHPSPMRRGGEIVKKVYPHQIAFNCLPHIDVFLENGYTKEEMKMVNETKKIMEAPEMAITATTVRVPVFRSHSESVNIETEKKLTPEEAREILSNAPGVIVVDDLINNKYPLAIDAEGRDETFVGRIREDFSVLCGLNMWIVSDNLRKGAASNAVQIAEIVAQTFLSVSVV